MNALYDNTLSKIINQAFLEISGNQKVCSPEEAVKILRLAMSRVPLPICKLVFTKNNFGSKQSDKNRYWFRGNFGTCDCVKSYKLANHFLAMHREAVISMLPRAIPSDSKQVLWFDEHCFDFEPQLMLYHWDYINQFTPSGLPRGDKDYVEWGIPEDVGIPCFRVWGRGANKYKKHVVGLANLKPVTITIQVVNNGPKGWCIMWELHRKTRVTVAAAALYAKPSSMMESILCLT